MARFLTVDDELTVSRAQAYALVRSGAPPAIKVGGRGQWRVERVKLEDYRRRVPSDCRRYLSYKARQGAGG